MKKKDTLPPIYTDYIIKEGQDIYLHDTDHEPEFFVLDEDNSVVIPGPQGKTGSQGVQGQPGQQGIPGPKGNVGNAGVRGLSGTQGTTGKQGIQGDPGEAAEVELCTINHDPNGGIRFRSGGGTWSQCVRIKGFDGRRGAAASQGGGGGGGSSLPQDDHKQITTLVPANSTKTIHSLSKDSTRAVKWIITIEGLTTGNFSALESLTINKNTDVDWDMYGLIGDYVWQDFDISFVCVNIAPTTVLGDWRLNFEFTNNTSEDFKVDIDRLVLVVKSL